VAKRAVGRKLPAAVLEEKPAPKKELAPRCLRAHHRDWYFNRRTKRVAICFVANSADFQSTIIVVQHMPEGFTEMFAKRLDECCALEG